MSDKGIRRSRKLLTAATLTVFAVLAVIVLIGVTPTGNWISVEAGDMQVERDGLNLTAGCDISLDSSIPYDISDMECELVLIDRENGSVLSLGEIAPVTVTANGSSDAHISAEIFAPGALLILSDMVNRDGSVLHFNLKVSCGYLMGLADIDLDMDLDLPLSEPGDRLRIAKERVSQSEFRIDAKGLSEKLVPGDAAAVFTGNGKKVSLTVDSEGRDTCLVLKSDGKLERTMESISSADDFSVKVSGGLPQEPDRETLRSLASLIGLLERI